MGEGTGSSYSCSTTVNGQMLIFGGQLNSAFENQISVVESCGLRRIGDLPMNFYYGACNTFIGQDQAYEHALLCFAKSGKNQCHRYRQLENV